MHTYAYPGDPLFNNHVRCRALFKTSDRSFRVPCKYYDTQMMMMMIFIMVASLVGGQNLIDSFNSLLHTRPYNKMNDGMWNVSNE